MDQGRRLRAMKKRSEEQEKRVARLQGGRVTPASGALSGAKGDVRQRGRHRIECKYTTKKSYSIKLDELLKIEGEASAGELSLLHLEFQGVSPSKRYVILREDDYQSLMEDAENGRNQDD